MLCNKTIAIVKQRAVSLQLLVGYFVLLDSTKDIVGESANHGCLIEYFCQSAGLMIAINGVMASSSWHELSLELNEMDNIVPLF